MVIHEIDAVRSDGGLVHMRPVRDTDRDGLLALNARVSEDSIYRRFFTVSRHAADVYVDQLLSPPGVEHQALVAIIGDEIVGVAAFERLTLNSAEMALLIDDRYHTEGIGTLLIEHLASIAREYGIMRFIADVQSDNVAMLRLVHNLGFAATAEPEYGTIRLTFGLDTAAGVVAAIDERERSADAASLRPLLAPKSVAVVGASTRPNSIGHTVLRNIIDGGFTGSVYVVNPNHTEVAGVPSFPSPRDLPVAPDLAVIAVPAAAVLDVVQGCGERGTHGIVLLTAGFGEVGVDGKALQRKVVAKARRYGMRLIGPNCLGLLNTDPAVRLNATFARLPGHSGKLGLVSQSGALGIAVLQAAERYGLAVSQFVSVGNKADVSSNDLLLSWERDDRTTVIALYLESMGNPRKFARIARRVSRTKPVIAIKAGRSLAGQRAGQSHTAAAASSDAVVDALFTQAGVLRVDGMPQMLDVARLLSEQPVPAGPRVAIVGNSGGPGILAADAAEAAGLDVVELDAATEAALREVVPTAASCQNPVDLGAGVQPDQVREVARIALEQEAVDCLLAVFTELPLANVDEIVAAVADSAAKTDKTVAVVQVGGVPRSMPVAGTTHELPIYTFPETAAAAMGFASRYGRIRAAMPGDIVRLGDVDVDGARAMVADRALLEPGWLGPEDVARLLIRYGIPMSPQRIVSDADSAAQAAAELGYPVVAKLVGGPVHKTDVGGVRLGIADEAGLREAFAAITAAAPDAAGVLLQPMVRSGGTELIAGAIQDPQFGPVVMLGAGGVLADMIADRQFRLAPLAASDADEMIAGLRTAPLLDGYRGREPVSREAVRDVVLRLASLADDLPQVAELDLNPVICHGDELVVVDAKVRLAPAPAMPDPVLRQLRV